MKRIVLAGRLAGIDVFASNEGRPGAGRLAAGVPRST